MSSICHRCPECHSTRVVTTLKTIYGAYCHCQGCDHAWHDDALPPVVPGK